MEEKRTTKISLSTFLLTVAIIIIAIMGIFIYKLNNDKTSEIQKSTELQTQVNSLNEKVSDLQGKLDSASKTINSNNSDENTTTTNNISFTDEQVEKSLLNYLEITATNGCTDLLEWLSQKGNINYNSSENNELDNGIIITNVKFSDYKNGMLNYVSETEFEKNWNSTFFGENYNGYLTTVNGGGSCPIYTIKSITKTGDMDYTAQTSYIVDESEPTPSYDKDFNFTIKSYNGICVIDSIK